MMTELGEFLKGTKNSFCYVSGVVESSNLSTLFFQLLEQLTPYACWNLATEAIQTGCNEGNLIP